MRLSHGSILASLAALLGACTLPRLTSAAFTQRDPLYERPGVLARHILEGRGYLAKDFNLRSRDGYTIRVTRGRNPLINRGRGGLPGRAPILLVHGVLESPNVWLVNSFDVKGPSDLTANTTTSLARKSLEELKRKLGDVPSAKSLALLALDFGHEVFLMSRRGFPGSQELAGDPNKGAMDDDGQSRVRVRGPLSAVWHGLTNYGHLAQQVRFSLNRKFWNYSLDEQARYDFPMVVDFVRENTGHDKIALVGQSVGGAIPLMSLSLFPELNRKLSAVILWSPAFTAGSFDRTNMIRYLSPILRRYVGPIPPPFWTEQVQGVLGALCKTRLMQWVFCETIGDSFLGFSSGLQPMRPEFISSMFYPTASHELEQLIQTSILGGQLHHYHSENVYDAKPYNLSSITNTKISIYVGTTDGLLTNSKAVGKLLRVPYRFHRLNPFNHNSYFYNVDNARRAIIPTLKEIHELSEERPSAAARAQVTMAWGRKNGIQFKAKATT